MAELIGAFATVVGLVEPLGTSVTNIVKKVESFIGQRKELSIAREKIEKAIHELTDVERLLQRYGEYLNPDDRSDLEDKTYEMKKKVIADVKDNIISLEDLVKRTSTKNAFRRIFREEKISKQINDVTDNVDFVLGTCSFFKRHINVVAAVNEQASPQQPLSKIFIPLFDFPDKSKTAVYNFSVAEASTTAIQREAELKRQVIQLNSKHGKLEDGENPLTGICGIGGTGKTYALIGLAHDKEMRYLFKDGIIFLELSDDEPEAERKKKFAEILRKTGGTHLTKDIERSHTLKDAVIIAAPWLVSQKILFLIDNLGGTERAGSGNVSAVVSLMNCIKGAGSRSVIAVSTRNRFILRDHCQLINFEPLEATGPISRRIFLLRANRAMNSIQTWPLEYNEDEETIDEILTYCGGIPLMLAAAGGSLTNFREGTTNWGEALNLLIKSIQSFEDRNEPLSQYVDDYPDAFIKIISTCLANANEFLKSVGVRQPSAKALFIRLCTIENGEFISNKIMKMLWPELGPRTLADFRRKLIQLNMLVTRHEESEDSDTTNTYVSCHDILLAYCRKEAHAGNQFANCHIQLLDEFQRSRNIGTVRPSEEAERKAQTYLSASERSVNRDFPFFRNLRATKNEYLSEIIDCTRPWWLLNPDTEEDKFIIKNLFRILNIAERKAEIIGVITHAKWSKLRVDSGDLATLFEDCKFSVEVAQEMQNISKGVAASLCNIRHTIGDMGHIIVKNPKVISSEVHSRLQDIDDPKKLIARYISTSAECSEACFRSVKRYLPEPRGSKYIEVATGIPCEVVEVNWEDMVVLLLDENKFYEVDLKRRAVVREEEVPYQCLAVLQGGKFLVLCDEMDIIGWNRDQGRMMWTEMCPGKIETSACLRDDQMIVVAGKTEEDGRGWYKAVRPFLGDVYSTNEDAHVKGISCIAISGDSNICLTGSTNGVIKVWELSSGRELFSDDSSSSWTNAVATNFKGSTIAFARDDNVICFGERVQDGTGFKITKQIELQESVGEKMMKFSDDGKYIIYCDNEGNISKRDADSKQEVFSLSKAGEYIKFLTLSPDGKYAIAVDEDGLVKYWNTNEEQEIPSGSVLSNLGIRNRRKSYQAGEILRVGFNHAEKKLYSVSKSNDLNNFDITDGKRGTARPLRDIKPYTAAFSPTGDFMALGEGKSLSVRKIDGGDPIFYKGEAHKKPIEALALNNVNMDSTIASLGDEGTVIWWKGDGSEHRRTEIDTGIYHELAVSEDGSRLVATTDEKIYFLEKEDDTLSEKMLWRNDIFSISMSADGEIVALGDSTGNIHVRKWGSEGIFFHRYDAHVGPIRDIEICHDKKTIISVGEDKQVVAWEMGQVDENALSVLTSVTIPGRATSISHMPIQKETQQEYVGVGDSNGGVYIFEMKRR